MKLENKEIALVIKPFPTYLLIQSNNHEQKLPYNDITNTFIHYVNINKIPPQLQENFQNLRVQIIKSETENYIVDLKSQNEHELNLDPSVDVYHKEKVKHYNETKFDFIKFKKKEHKKKMINIINEVRNKNYESSVTVFEGRNKKCQRFMVLCKGVGSNVESSFDMTSKFVKSLKELKKGGGSSEVGINSLKNSLELNGSSNSIVGPGSGFSLLDTELYGNFNSLSKDKQILLTKKIHAKENMHYLTVFVIAAERPYCVVRYGDKVNTHNKGYVIKHTIPKNIGEYFENIKSNYAHLGFAVKNEAGQNLKSTKRFHVNDISSRIHESPNLEAPKKSDSYEQSVYIHSRPSPKDTNNIHPNKTFVASQPGYNQIDPQIVNKKQQQVNPQNNYQVTPNLRINQNKNQKSNDSSQNSRQSIDSFNSKDMNTEMAYNSNRPVQNKPMHKPYMPEYQGMNPMMQQYPPQPYSHKQQGFPSQRHTIIAQQTARGRHIYTQPPQIYRQPTPHQSPIMPQNGNMINYPSNYGNNLYNLKPNYSVNLSVLYEDPRAKANPSHINNINMKQQTPEKEEKSTKQRKDEAQDMPDFF